jgi:hypothetical protein
MPSFIHAVCLIQKSETHCFTGLLNLNGEFHNVEIIGYAKEDIVDDCHVKDIVMVSGSYACSIIGAVAVQKLQCNNDGVMRPPVLQSIVCENLEHLASPCILCKTVYS